MPYSYYRRRNYRSGYRRPLANKAKYSQETKSFIIPAADLELHDSLYQAAYKIVPDTSIQGMRKVKHINISMTSSGSSDSVNPIYWAIVYVPEGFNLNSNGATSPNWLKTNDSLYEPNQYIMNCGVVDPSAGPIRFSTPLARNLNSGDMIYLVIGLSSNTAGVGGVAKYAITMM